MFTTEAWNNLQKNTVHSDPGEQDLVLWACLEQHITEKGGQLWQSQGEPPGYSRYSQERGPQPTGQSMTCSHTGQSTPQAPLPQQDGLGHKQVTGPSNSPPFCH
jgi:hypothetical protein